MIDPILALAHSKGWNGKRMFDPAEPNNAEADYLILTQLNRWLQKRDIYINVAPFLGDTHVFGYFVHMPMGQEPKSFGGYNSFDTAFAAAIEEALKLIPDANKNAATNN